MKKWKTISQAGSVLALDCKSKEDVGINCVKANSVCKHVFTSIANMGWRYTKVNLYSRLRHEEKLKLNHKTALAVERVVNSWIEGPNFLNFVFRPKFFKASNLIKKYRK